jgi:hypothetical protein
MENIFSKFKCEGGGKTAIAIILILVLGGIATVSILRDRIVNYPQYQVSVTGQGKVSYQPDLATVTLGVQIDKVAKADEALNQLNARIKNIVSAVKTQGVAPEDIVTQSYSLYPQYDYNNNISTVSGYNANQQISIKIRDLKSSPDKISQVLAAASKAGTNQVLGINFDVADLENLKQEARLKALADARAKANVMASAAGVRLKDIVGWWDNVIQAPGAPSSYSDYGKGGSASGGGGGGVNYVPSTIPTGNQEIIVEVSVSYRLK